MKRLFKFFSGITMTIILSGCIGENYDFSPPTVTLSNPENSMQEITLTEANINWHYDKKYNKKTKDIQELAKKQPPIVLQADQKVDYLMEDGYFEPDRISVSLMKNENEWLLELEEVESFTLPHEAGEYTVVFDVKTEHGNAQYVGRIIIE